MDSATCYIVFSDAGNATGVGGTPDGTLPPGAVACTADQAAAWPLATLASDAIVMAEASTRIPTLAEQAVAMLAAGLTIASTGTPALSGTYAVDAAAQSHIQAEVTAILLNGMFADGTASLAWPDVSGAIRTFSSVAEFKLFASAVSSRVAALFAVINGTLTVLPPASVTIA